MTSSPATTDDQTVMLSNEEIGTVRRFMALLHDTGAQVQVSLAWLSLHGDSEQTARGLAAACEDLIECEPAEVSAAAPSLKMLVDAARHVDSIPEDCVPSDELVKSCLDAFYAALRHKCADTDD